MKISFSYEKNAVRVVAAAVVKAPLAVLLTGKLGSTFGNREVSKLCAYTAYTANGSLIKQRWRSIRRDSAKTLGRETHCFFRAGSAPESLGLA